MEMKWFGMRTIASRSASSSRPRGEVEEWFDGLTTPSIVEARLRWLCIVAAVCLSFYSANVWGAEMGTPEKDLLFHVSFNAQSPLADFAKGKAQSTNFTRTLQYLTAPGVSGIGLETLENESCNYEMAGNFNPEQGTLGIWVRPENWRPSEARPPYRRVHLRMG